MAKPKLIEVLPGKWVNPLYVTSVDVTNPEGATHLSINTVGSGGIYLSGFDDDERQSIKIALKALGLEPPKEQESS